MDKYKPSKTPDDFAPLEQAAHEAKVKKMAHKLTGLLMAWLDSTRETPSSGSTVRQCETQLLKFMRWVYVRHNGAVTDISQEDYATFLSAVAKADYSSSTKRIAEVYVKHLMRYLISKGYISDFNLTVPEMQTARHSSGKTKRSIPAYASLCEIRSMAWPIERALAVELMLSSGMRIGELIQLRFCDIKPGDVPVDIGEERPSRYAAGSITLNKHIHKLKRAKSRKTHYSFLAGRLLSIYMQLNKIPGFRTKQRILPWTESAINLWMSEMNESVNFRAFGVAGKHSIINPNEEDELSDEEWEALPDGMKRMVERRNQSLPETPQKVLRGDQVTNVTSHSFRHFFACCQLFRDYRGGHSDMTYVMSLLGHVGSDTTLQYLSDITILETKEQWSKVYRGAPGTWANIKALPYEHYKRRETMAMFSSETA
jgi:integrase